MTIDVEAIRHLGSPEVFPERFGLSDTDIIKRRKQVHTSLLNQSKNVSQSNFCNIDTEDL